MRAIGRTVLRKGKIVLLLNLPDMKNLFVLVCIGISAAASGQQALFIPDTLVGPSYNLTMHKDSMQFFPGRKTLTYAYNSNKYLGPTLILHKGANITITVSNQIGDTTTVHWHGLHIPPTMDGGPHSPILPNATWSPQFTVMNNAATFWYHPHLHMKTAVQAIKGADGMIIIRDPAEAALALPRKYGVDDFPVIVQSIQFDSVNQPMPKGMVDSTLLVNGTMNPYLNLPAQLVRLRLLNASGERTFNFGFTGNRHFKMIASDGGLLAVPYDTTRIRLSPGERAEVLIDLNGMVAQSFYLLSYGSELPMGIQGGPTMPMPPPSPPMNSPLNGIDFNIMKINVTAATPGGLTTIPATLVPFTPYSAANANITRTIRMTADSAMVMDGPFYFNGNSFDMMRVDYVIPLNNIEIWKLVNTNMVAHPFHIHDVQFNILDRNNGIAPSPEERGWKDVVLVPPGDSVRFITQFRDFADTTVPYMFHCHILMHEDAGMMGQFVVSSKPAGIKEKHLDGKILVFPNPARDVLNISIPNFNGAEAQTVRIYDLSGRALYSCSATRESMTILTSHWSRGMYLLSLEHAGQTSFEKFVLE
jgi:blue copper oxidase